MSAFSVLLHWGHHLSNFSAYRRLQMALQNPREAHLEKVEFYRRYFRQVRDQRLPARWQDLPITHFADYAERVQELRAGSGDCLIPKPEQRNLRFEPTSGSTTKRKWIPYNSAFLTEFRNAASAWLFDLAQTYPAILCGKHYWSLSWLPTELRGEKKSNDDSELLPAWKRWVFAQISAVSGSVSLEPTLEQSLRKTAETLVNTPDLSLISVWSPTFLLSLLDYVDAHREKLAVSTRILDLLKQGRETYCRELWPDLAVISCWTTSSSQPWAEQLRTLFPQANIQGKGLWATEGVVTVPLGGVTVPALTAHLLEFKCLATNKIYGAYELEVGQRVQPLITAANGFVRYELPDLLMVDGRFAQTPTLTFRGRMASVDMVGEKVDAETALEILRVLRHETGDFNPITLIAEKSQCRYHLLCDLSPMADTAQRESIAQRLESLLCGFHHYRVARELHQLRPAGIYSVPNALQFYQKISGAQIVGGQKIEPLISVNALENHE